MPHWGNSNDDAPRRDPARLRVCGKDIGEETSSKSAAVSMIALQKPKSPKLCNGAESVFTDQTLNIPVWSMTN